MRLIPDPPNGPSLRAKPLWGGEVLTDLPVPVPVVVEGWKH